MISLDATAVNVALPACVVTGFSINAACYGVVFAMFCWRASGLSPQGASRA
jgi:hypothetical protein